MTISTSPYLFFVANCEPALAFYERCGLGRTVEIIRYGDRGLPVRNPALLGKIMHAQFDGHMCDFTPPTMMTRNR